MHLTVIIPAILITFVLLDLLRGILAEGRKRMQSKQRRDALLRWVREAQVGH